MSDVSDGEVNYVEQFIVVSHYPNQVLHLDCGSYDDALALGDLEIKNGAQWFTVEKRYLSAIEIEVEAEDVEEVDEDGGFYPHEAEPDYSKELDDDE